MKKSRMEQRLFDAADSLTPPAPSFEQATKKVDWEAVPLNQASPRKRVCWPIMAGGITALFIASVVGVAFWVSSANAGSETTSSEAVITSIGESDSANDS